MMMGLQLVRHLSAVGLCMAMKVGGCLYTPTYVLVAFVVLLVIYWSLRHRVVRSWACLFCPHLPCIDGCVDEIDGKLPWIRGCHGRL